MILFGNLWDCISPFLVWVIGYFFINVSLSRIIKLDKKRTLILYIWHSIWAIIYIILTLLYTNDSLLYYARAQKGDLNFMFGTGTVVYITYILSQKLYLSFISIYAFFNIIGSIGLIIFDKVIQEINRVPKNLNWIIKSLVFLPSVSFWSCAIGKDAIGFTATIFFLWSSIDIRKRIIFNILSAIMMFFIRPHIGIIMIYSLLLGFILSSKIKAFDKLFITLLISVITFYITIQAFDFFRIENINDLSNFYEKRVNLNLSGSIDYDQNQYPILIAIIFYIVRPSIFDINGPLALFAAIENTLILFLIIITIAYLFKGNRLPKNSLISFPLLITYISSSSFILASTTSNLGIAMRQKWMFMPMLFIVIISILNKKFKKIYIKKLKSK